MPRGLQLAKLLDHAAESCRSRLVRDNIVLDQMDAKFDVRKVCEGIFEDMREEGLIFGPGRSMFFRQV